MGILSGPSWTERKALQPLYGSIGHWHPFRSLMDGKESHAIMHMLTLMGIREGQPVINPHGHKGKAASHPFRSLMDGKEGPA